MRPGSIYSMHPGFKMVEASLRNLRQRTGRDRDEWIEIVRRDGPPVEKDQREWLKKEHGFTTNYAMWVVEEANGKSISGYDPDAYVEQQYAGKKAALYPLYEVLLHLGLGLGPDVIASPGATIVPLYRKNCFAQIKPTTNTRIDLGLCLRGIEPQGRLLDTGGDTKGDRINRRIAVTSEDDLDGELTIWLRKAYDAAS
jgi:hypothetical protein